MVDRILAATSRTIADETNPGETVSSWGPVWGLEAMTMAHDVVEQPGETLRSVPLPLSPSVDRGDYLVI